MDDDVLVQPNQTLLRVAEKRRISIDQHWTRMRIYLLSVGVVRFDTSLLQGSLANEMEETRHHGLEDDEYFDSLLRLSLQQPVQAVMLSPWSAKIHFYTGKVSVGYRPRMHAPTWRQPPVHDEDTLLREKKRPRHVPEVISTVYEPLRRHVQSDGRKAIEAILLRPMARRGDTFKCRDPLIHLSLLGASAAASNRVRGRTSFRAVSFSRICEFST